MATTAPPTTLLPTTLSPTTSVVDVVIVCDPIVVQFWPLGVLSYAGGGRNPLLDRFIRANSIDIEIEQVGDLLEVIYGANVNEIEIEILGEIVPGIKITCTPIEIEIFPRGGVTVQAGICNWIAWSKIGSLDFTIDETNVAGKMPVDWRGCVLNVLTLGRSPVAYGENGVTVFKPVDVKMAMKTIHRIGVKWKEAVAGNEFEHFFIDKTNKLYRLSEESGLEELDYSEYLSSMTYPKLSLDISNRILYICDGTYGFVYGIKSKSFGEGPRNISGVGYRDGNIYVSSPTVITMPKFEIATDIYDLGTRKPKTIQEVEVGTDLQNNLEVMIEGRLSNKMTFVDSRWVLLNPSGRAQCPCFGIEFRIHLRSYIYEYLELDYIKVNGTMHEFGYLEAT